VFGIVLTSHLWINLTDTEGETPHYWLHYAWLCYLMFQVYSCTSIK